MTISSTTRTAGPYAGTGVQQIFGFNFKVFLASDMTVILTNAAGAISIQTLTSNYTVSLNPDQNTAPGGNITMLVAPPAGTNLTITSQVPNLQPSDIANVGNFYPRAVTDALDRGVIQVQQLAVALQGTVRGPSGETLSPMPGAVGRAGNILGFDSLGNPIATIPASGSGTQLAIDMLDSVNLSKGAALLFGVTRNVTSIAVLRTLPKTGSKQVFVMGYYATADGGGGTYYYDASDTTSSDNGGTVIVAADGGRWKLIFNQRISVKQFGAKGGSNDDTAAIQAAVTFGQSLTAVTTSPAYQTPTIWFDHDVYGLSSPIRFTQGLKIGGDNARLLALSGFAGQVINKFGGGSITLSSMFIFINGLYGDTSGGGLIRWAAQVGPGLLFDCNFLASTAIYIERFPYSHIECEVQNSGTDGIQIGPQMWGVTLENIITGNCTTNALAFMSGAAANGITIKNPRIWGQFLTGYCGINFMDGAACNGVTISGGFIEKVTYGILCGKLCGPVNIIGMDFEQCDLGVVRLVGDLTGGILVGPVKLLNCFIHAVNGPKLYCDSGLMTAEGCRFYTTVNGTDVQTDLNLNGSIMLINSQFAGGVIGMSPGSNVVYDQNNGATRVDGIFKSHKSAAFIQNYALKNYPFRDTPTLQGGGLDFVSFYVGGGTGQYVTRSTWFTSQFDFVTNPNATSKTIGVRLANDSTQNAFEPMLDNVTSCGEATARWTTVYAVTGAINTSDERQKQQIRPLLQAELAVAAKLKGMIRAFKFNDSVDEKGTGARIHVGVIAQDVKAAFESEGLVAEDYAVLCHDVWDARDALLGEDGEVVVPARAAGDQYGVRYEELIAFMLGAL